MKEYFKIVTVDESKLNPLLSKGWEVIETTKNRDVGGEYVIYHIGFPLNKAFEIALEILKEYDKHDFRLKLVECVANEIGTDFNEYKSTNDIYYSASDPVTDVYEKTDFLLSGVDFPKYIKVNNTDKDYDF